MDPKYVSSSEVPEEEVNKQKEIFRTQVLAEGKPANIVDKIVEGKINKFFGEICLLDQPFVKNPDLSINDLLNEKIAKIGENIVISRIVRFELGR
jgi:elongation factor Ts